MNISIFIIGLISVLVSFKKLRIKIKDSGVKTILPLPVWTIVCLAAGIFIGYNSIHLSSKNFSLIAGLLFLTIPLQAWIDKKYIFKKDEIWNAKDFLFACSYEIGLILIGLSSIRLFIFR